MADVSNGGVRIHYEVEGSGPPLVLQHGVTSSLDSWRAAGYVDALKSSYRVVLVDARGHGASDKPHDRAAYALVKYVGDIAAVLDALRIERAHYWGYSMGGWIGFGMAKHAPERLRTLIIGGMHPYERSVKPGLPNGEDARAFLAAYGQRVGVDFEALPEAAKRHLLANDTRALAASVQDQPSLETLLPKMHTPSLLYAGDADGVFARVRNAADAIPNCTFVPLPGCTHHQAFHGAAEKILPHVLNFLRLPQPAL
jgi:pimeloyl-ACP methyl ester carboxylesterase